MTDVKQAEFGHRLQRIDRAHRQLSHGYVTSIGADGLIIAKPRRRTSKLPLRGLFLSLLVLITFKGFVYAQIGGQAYQDRVALLESGSIVEQVGAYAMYADPVTLWIAKQISTIL